MVVLFGLNPIYNILLYVFFSFVFCFVVFFRVKTYYEKHKRKKDYLGSLLKVKADMVPGIIFGRVGRKLIVSPVNDKQPHIMVIGGSGLGKTSALLIPTLRTLNNESFFCVDISGDIYKNTASYIKNKMVFAPRYKYSCFYNIFGFVDKLKNRADKLIQIEKLALIVCPQDPNAKDAAAFYQRGALNILKGALIAGYFKGHDYCEICEALYNNSYNTMFKAIKDSGITEAGGYIASFEGQNDSNISGCYGRVADCIELFATNAYVKRVCRRAPGAYVPTVLEHKGCYVIIEDEDLELYQPLLRIIVAQTMEYLGRRSLDTDKNVLVCLDEFSSLGQIDILPALRKFRKRHVRLLMLTQSVNDLRLNYGPEASKAILDNISYFAVLGANDPDTQDYISRKIGLERVKEYSYTSNGVNKSETTSERKDNIVDPADLGRLGDDLILIHPFGYMRIRKNYYFKN